MTEELELEIFHYLLGNFANFLKVEVTTEMLEDFIKQKSITDTVKEAIDTGSPVIIDFFDTKGLMIGILGKLNKQGLEQPTFYAYYESYVNGLIKGVFPTRKDALKDAIEVCIKSMEDNIK